MNKRNLEIFGLSLFKKRIWLGVGALLLLAGLFFAGKTALNAERISLGAPATGATTVDVEQEVQQAQEQDVQQQETIAQEQPQDEQINPLEYGPTCGVDIRNAQDDVSDVEEYVREKQELYDEIKAEYEQKKQELEDFYAYDLQKLEDDIADDQQDLVRVQQQLQDVLQRCGGEIQ